MFRFDLPISSNVDYSGQSLYDAIPWPSFFSEIFSNIKILKYFTDRK